MKLKTTLAAALLALSTTGSALAADAIPYPNPGTANPDLYAFSAVSTGTVTAYFMGSTAGYENTLGLLVNGVDTGINGLNDHTSVVGDSLVFNVTAGDVLTFYIKVTSPALTWYSDASLNSDGVNHIYSTSFSGSSAVPAGTYIAFEDLQGGGDLNYFDETFAFTNVATTSTVPEPANMALLMAGLGLLGFMAKRRQR